MRARLTVRLGTGTERQTSMAHTASGVQEIQRGDPNGVDRYLQVYAKEKEPCIKIEVMKSNKHMKRWRRLARQKVESSMLIRDEYGTLLRDKDLIC